MRSWFGRNNLCIDMLRLQNRKVFPKDGFPYIQPETGRVFAGMFSFNYNAKEIFQHRKDNQLSRATLQESADDLDTYTCNQHPEFCFDPGGRVPEQPRRTSSCAGCGGGPR